MQKHIREHSVGTIQSHFNVEAASSAPVPAVPTDDQAAISQELLEERAWFAKGVTLVNRQIELLKEHRQALITAAVTGQLDISQPAPAVPA